MSKKYELMSIKELKHEMKKCNNAMKKKLIKKLIEYKELEKPNSMYYNNDDKNDDDMILNELIKHQNNDYDNMPDEYHERQDNDEEEIVHDNNRTKNMKDMVNKDLANNKMMERLNGELNFRINGFNKKYIDKPYIDDIKKDKRIIKNYSTSDQISDLSSAYNHDIPDFTSKKWIEKKI